jgi:hypothetical protein
VPRKINVPFAFGLVQRIDPKLAPFGVLRTASNLRVQKDGRLVSRTGYQPLTMGSVAAYDLHEFGSGRLCALAAQQGEGFPVDLYEYTGVPTAAPWRAASQSADGLLRPALTPFTAPREVCGVPQPGGGVSSVDCAAGDGFVCTVYLPRAGTGNAFMQVVRASDDQVIRGLELSFNPVGRCRVCFAANTFFIVGQNSSNSLMLISYNPTTDVTSSLATIESGGATKRFDVEAVRNPTNSHIIVIYGEVDAGANDVLIKRYNSAGAQQGSTLTIAVVGETANANFAIEADEADNTVNSVIRDSSGAGATSLRTHNFSNALLDGPTSVTDGTHHAICRLPARSGWTEHVAVVSTIDTGDDNVITVEWFDVDAHTITATRVIANAKHRSAIIPASATGQPSSVVFGGFVEGSGDDSTNALWYVSTSMVHQATRDLRNSAEGASSFFEPLGLSLDTSTGRIAWASLYKTSIASTDKRGAAVFTESFSITTLALNSAARRQATMAGGQLYLTGGPVQVYDGRVLTECRFNEIPRIVSLTGDTAGSLSPEADYSYVLVFEYALPDGTFVQSPPSLPFDITTAAGQDEVNVVVQGPHSARVALGAALLGSQVTGVLYRTFWDAATETKSSTFHEVVRFNCPSTLADYGDDIAVTDTVSDAAAQTRAVLYTQQGPTEDNSPEMATYISSSSSRLTVGGLARTAEVQESKEQPIDQGAAFGGLSSFFVRCPDPVTGVVSLDGIRLVMSRSDIYAIQGDGPDDAGTGALPPPVALGSPSGLRDWRSLLVAPDGVWAQLDDSKLYRIPRAGGAPEWVGVDVQDTLAAFPDITGAARCRQDDTIVFACQNSGGTSGRLVHRSLRTGIWLEDTPPLTTSEGIEALSSYGDRIAYVSGGVVFAQSESGFTDGASSVIVTEWQTEPIYPFEVGGNGHIHDIQVTGEFRSAGTLALRVSYDDGVSFEAHDSFALTGTAGDTVKRRWSIRRSDIQSIVAEFIYTPSSPGAGLVITQMTLLVDPSQGLEDLDPAEMGS